MILFTCKKYDFLIEKNLPSLSTYFATLESEIEFIRPATQNQGGAFTEDLSEFRQIYLWIQVFVDKVMVFY
ncbi:hypothetical protein [Leptospira weilii]|uniref:hypothetical protein n=1 Tax=Leptospira weilii TaxID=28184 RepID=UPI0007735B6D|nr:hypothetical protein [Leptospira weilii]